MPTSSKTPDVNILVRLGVLEKLVDTLFDRVAKVESSVKGTENIAQNVLQIVDKLQGEAWDNKEEFPVQPTPSKTPTEDKTEQKDTHDDLDQILG